MWKIEQILTVMNDLAPFSLAMEQDSVGLLVGRADKPIERVFVTLDITTASIKKASAAKAELILSHHPYYWRQLPRPTDESFVGEITLQLCERGLAAIAMHTNLDAALGGVNDRLATLVGLNGKPEVLDEETGIGRYGALASPMSARELAKHVRQVLGCTGIRLHDAKKPCLLVAVCGGSGGEYVRQASLLGCDTLITADVRHHEYLEAQFYGINLLDAGHFATENIVLPVLSGWLESQLSGLDIIVDTKTKEPYICL